MKIIINFYIEFNIVIFFFKKNESNFFFYFKKMIYNEKFWVNVYWMQFENNEIMKIIKCFISLVLVFINRNQGYQFYFGLVD